MTQWFLRETSLKYQMTLGQGQEMALTLTILTSFHLLNLFSVSTYFQATGCNSFWNIQFSLFLVSYKIWPCCKIGQGHTRVIIWKNYNGQESQMLHNKFCGNRPAGSGDFWSVFTIYGYGGHLGHVTSIISINFHFHVPKSLRTKFG